jgi:hypothetical protein
LGWRIESQARIAQVTMQAIISVVRTRCAGVAAAPMPDHTAAVSQ